MYHYPKTSGHIVRRWVLGNWTERSTHHVITNEQMPWIVLPPRKDSMLSYRTDDACVEVVSSISTSWLAISLLCVLSCNTNLSDSQTHSRVINSTFVGKNSLKTYIRYMGQCWKQKGNLKEFLKKANNLQKNLERIRTSTPSWVIFTDCLFWEREETMLNTETASTSICGSKVNRS